MDNKGSKIKPYPNGHLGHLTTEQKEALEAFKHLLDKDETLTEAKTSILDAKLLRFLRARRWVVKDALRQYKDTEEWRAANQVDKLYKTVDEEVFKTIRSIYPQWTGRRDHKGHPVCFIDFRGITGQQVASCQKKMAQEPIISQAKSEGEKLTSDLSFATVIEYYLQFIQPFGTQLPDREHAETTPVTLITYIFEISGLSLSHCWGLRNYMHTTATMLSAYYPESLGCAIIIGAPSFFHIVWKWLTAWLDPVTAAKFTIVSHKEDPLSVLERIIEKKNIPKMYGGDLDYEYGQPPVADPAWDGVIVWDKDVTTFPIAPLLWEAAEDNEKKMTCVRVGCQHGEQQHQRICTISKS